MNYGLFIMQYFSICKCYYKKTESFKQHGVHMYFTFLHFSSQMRTVNSSKKQLKILYRSIQPATSFFTLKSTKVQVKYYNLI